MYDRLGMHIPNTAYVVLIVVGIFFTKKIPNKVTFFNVTTIILIIAFTILINVNQFQSLAYRDMIRVFVFLFFLTLACTVKCNTEQKIFLSNIILVTTMLLMFITIFLIISMAFRISCILEDLKKIINPSKAVFGSSHVTSANFGDITRLTYAGATRIILRIAYCYAYQLQLTTVQAEKLFL